MNYPVARREPIVDRIHGVEVPDPYRWLEDGESEEVRAWTEAQNALTSETLARVPGHEAIRERLEGLLSIGTVSPPVVRGGRLFYLRREGGQDQPILYRREGVRGEERVLVDPTLYSPEHTAALDWWYPSPDGRLLAYGISHHGDEKSVLGIRVVETGEDLADRIPHTRFATVAWLPDSSGFYYTRYPEPGSVPEGEEDYWVRIHFHTPGADRRDDSLVFGEGRPKEDMLCVQVSPDGRWVCVTAQRGWAQNDVYLLDRQAPERGFATVVEGIEALFIPEIQDDALYLRTNHEAPNYRMFRADPERPERANWTEIIPEEEGVLAWFEFVAGHLVCEYLRDAQAQVRLHRPDGTLARELESPGICSFIGAGGEWNGGEVYAGYVSFTMPPAVYRYDLPSGKAELWERVEAPVDPDDYEVRQVWFPSRDGTRVSMFVVHRKGLTLDGDRPALLYGYGGFNATLTPMFVRGAYLLLERGGIFAMPNLRGGGEYGEAWHRGGMRETKQNTFDDCIAAAEHLIREGYTRPERLAVQGGSNGGLLVGAVVTQRPDLFRAAICQVPLLDMVRYHQFSIARLWIPEYGSSEDPEQFRYLYAYSPYHRIREGERYPATLIAAAESDTRVDPLHARKFAAAIQAANTAGTPVLLRIETRAGHGAGKPISKIHDELTDIWSFLFQQLGIPARRDEG